MEGWRDGRVEGHLGFGKQEELEEEEGRPRGEGAWAESLAGALGMVCRGDASVKEAGHGGEGVLGS